MRHLTASIGLLLLLHMTGTCALPVEEDVITTITSFIIQNHAVSAVIFACWMKTDKIKLIAYWSARGLQTIIHVSEFNVDAILLLRTSYYPLAVIVDLQCEASKQILELASEQKLFNRLHHWLLIKQTNLSSKVLTKDDPLVVTLESLYLPLDSRVTVAHMKVGKNQVLLQEVYHIGVDQPLTVTSTKKWNIKLQLPERPRRTNYGGLSIPSIVLVRDDTWDSFMNLNRRHINTESKFHYVLMSHISDMLNFRMNICVADTWGYPINGSECFNGAVGMIQCGKCEIGTGILFKQERMKVIDYAADTMLFRGAFIFLKPSLSEVSVIYELPFNTSVWITYTVTVAILTAMLVFTRRVHQHVNPSSFNYQLGWEDAVMDSIAIVCQQDAVQNPKHTSSRIVFIFMLILAMFLVTSYSAIIVSLLQTSSDAINDLADLMKSPLKLSMVNYFVNETTDPQVTKVFKEKLYTQPFKEAFITEEEGMEKIRKGLYAFHTHTMAYKIISDTYEEHEKCRLKEIPMFTSVHVGFTIRKGSPYLPHIRERVLWLREVGLIDRTDKYWFYRKPKCDTVANDFISVRIKDFYPTLLILAFGIITSIVILVLEILYYKRHNIISHI